MSYYSPDGHELFMYLNSGNYFINIAGDVSLPVTCLKHGYLINRYVPDA